MISKNNYLKALLFYVFIIAEHSLQGYKHALHKTKHKIHDALILKKQRIELENDVVNEELTVPIPDLVWPSFGNMDYYICHGKLEKQEWEEYKTCNNYRRIKSAYCEVPIDNKIPTKGHVEELKGAVLRSQSEGALVAAYLYPLRKFSSSQPKNRTRFICNKPAKIYPSYLFCPLVSIPKLESFRAVSVTRDKMLCENARKRAYYVGLTKFIGSTENRYDCLLISCSCSDWKLPQSNHLIGVCNSSLKIVNSVEERRFE